jgi:CheY-like chemotaxis protein
MTESAKIKSSRRILLADDNRAVQEVVKRVAERRGHQLIQAMTGARTIPTAIEAQPDVIVLDLEFPDADGRDLLHQLKAEPRTANIPVVVWSGRGSHDSDGRIALDLGAEDFVEKSDAQLLIQKIERVLLRVDQSDPARSSGRG